MSPARTIYWFSFWVLASGLALLLSPEPALELMDIAPSAAPMARIFRMVLLYVGFYYFMAGRHGGMVEFYRWTTYARMSALPFALVLILADLVSPVLLIFIGVDLLGALATALAFRADRRRGDPAPGAQP